MLNERQKAVLTQFLQRNPALQGEKENLLSAYRLLKDCYDGSGLVLTCGNGGSAADSEHIVGELMKGFLSRRPLNEKDSAVFTGLADDNFPKKLQKALPAIALVSQTALLSAYANDVDASMVFAQQAYAYAKENDVLIGLSTSGNSANVVNAAIAAKAKGAKVIALTGEKESRLSELADVAFRVPSQETFIVQEYHLPIYHALCALIELAYFT
ncbi:MAG: SIS domain-containing protein [Clostridiales bacterium]|nr:SIS domain-containing protein [Clostridiales bacterium]